MPGKNGPCHRGPGSVPPRENAAELPDPQPTGSKRLRRPKGVCMWAKALEGRFGLEKTGGKIAPEALDAQKPSGKQGLLLCGKILRWIWGVREEKKDRIVRAGRADEPGPGPLAYLVRRPAGFSEDHPLWFLEDFEPFELSKCRLCGRALCGFALPARSRNQAPELNPQSRPAGQPRPRYRQAGAINRPPRLPWNPRWISFILSSRGPACDNFGPIQPRL